jgi:hypothetical protein
MRGYAIVQGRKIDFAPIFGIEIEAAISSEVRRATHIGDYHMGEHMPVKGWIAESDASVDSSDDLRYTIEMISCPRRIDAFMKQIDDLIEWLKQFGEFRDVIDFNKSCGCHIHFSMASRGDARWVEHFMQFYNLIGLRARVLKRIKREIGERQAKMFATQYYRNYAQKASIEDVYPQSARGRRVEFNYTTPDKGLEWRSFNLYGCESFNDMRKLIQIGVEELEKVMLARSEKVNVRIDKRLIDTLKEKNKCVNGTENMALSIFEPIVNGKDTIVAHVEGSHV